MQIYLCKYAFVYLCAHTIQHTIQGSLCALVIQTPGWCGRV
jgi:hypothetical protein